MLSVFDDSFFFGKIYFYGSLKTFEVGFIIILSVLFSRTLSRAMVCTYILLFYSRINKKSLVSVSFNSADSKFSLTAARDKWLFNNTSISNLAPRHCRTPLIRAANKWIAVYITDILESLATTLVGREWLFLHERIIRLPTQNCIPFCSAFILFHNFF